MPGNWKNQFSDDVGGGGGGVGEENVLENFASCAEMKNVLKLLPPLLMLLLLLFSSL